MDRLKPLVGGTDLDSMFDAIKHKGRMGHIETTDNIVQRMKWELNSRSHAGLLKYGTPLDRTDLNLLDWVRHAKEEAMDMALYLLRIEVELENDSKKV